MHPRNVRIAIRALIKDRKKWEEILTEWKMKS